MRAVFVDSNILIYSQDATDPQKQRQALNWLEVLSTAGEDFLERFSRTPPPSSSLTKFQDTRYIDAREATATNFLRAGTAWLWRRRCLRNSFTW
jgi:hypothetical protein